jgi:GDPmannose 4,6-dehydratase
MPVAFITGITGQDGSYLAELLLAKDYVVHGLVRRASMFNRSRIDPLRTGPAGQSGRLQLHYGELNDPTSLRRLLRKIAPQEVYHFAGQSHVGLSFEIPEVTCHENAMATLSLLESLRDLNYPVRLYHAASSEMFGAPKASPQTEATPFNPVNPYGCAKAFATQLCRVYRETHGLFVCSGIAYNHESPRRGENFVTRKITMAVARIKAGRQQQLSLGNLDGRRDWGYAPEYVRGMWLMLQQERPADYVLATNEAHSVRDFLAVAFDRVGLNWQDHVTCDPRLVRPTESTLLIGDYAQARQQLGWEPVVRMKALAELMVDADVAALSGAGEKIVSVASA